jgi:hypothetical protein
MMPNASTDYAAYEAQNREKNAEIAAGYDAELEKVRGQTPQACRLLPGCFRAASGRRREPGSLSR